MRRAAIERLLPAAYQRAAVPGSVLAALLDGDGGAARPGRGDARRGRRPVRPVPGAGRDGAVPGALGGDGPRRAAPVGRARRRRLRAAGPAARPGRPGGRLAQGRGTAAGMRAAGDGHRGNRVHRRRDRPTGRSTSRSPCRRPRPTSSTWCAGWWPTRSRRRRPRRSPREPCGMTERLREVGSMSARPVRAAARRGRHDSAPDGRRRRGRRRPRRAVLPRPGQRLGSRPGRSRRPARRDRRLARLDGRPAARGGARRPVRRLPEGLDVDRRAPVRPDRRRQPSGYPPASGCT